MIAPAPRRCSRRTLLASALVGLSGAPFVRWLGTAVARQPDATLQSFIGVFTPHGVARRWFSPRDGFDLGFDGSALAGFHDAANPGASLRERLLVIEGLDLTAGIQGGSAGHEGSRALLTGSGREGRNASLDQFLALEAGLGLTTPIASVALGVGVDEASSASTISYALGGLPLPKIIDPSATFHELVGQWIAGRDPESAARLEHQRLLGRSMLDTLRADLSRLARALGPSERVKLEHHLTALRGVESKLAGFELACATPDAPDAARFPLLRAYQGGEPYFDAITDLQIDLLVAAASCGVTRFATLYLADLSRTGLDAALPDDVHIDVAHRYRADGSGATDEEISALLARQNRYVYDKVARLASRLLEAELLDETLVMAIGDMGDPARHDSRNVPIVLAGGAQAGFRLGRHLDARTNGEGTPHNRLLVSIARAFGLELESFGEARDPTTTTGELPGLV